MQSVLYCIVVIMILYKHSGMPSSFIRLKLAASIVSWVSLSKMGKTIVYATLVFLEACLLERYQGILVTVECVIPQMEKK
jgi:hypothetical protein